MYELIVKKIILPLSDLFFNTHLEKYLVLLEESQYWSPGEIKVFQDEKLKLIINHAYQNVPYYNELFKKLKLTPQDFKTQQDLHKIPIMTKNEMKVNQNKMWAINPPRHFKNSSSGSTGEPFEYLIDINANIFSKATGIRAMGWHGFKLGLKYIKIGVDPREGFNKKLQDFFLRSTNIFSLSLNDNDCEIILNKIVKLNPKVIRSYPSTLSVLASYALQNNYKFKDILYIYCHGEILFPQLKKNIYEAFGAPVVDFYSGEGGAEIAECKCGNHYHIAEEFAITEIVKNDEIITEGTGEVVSTNLWNYSMPFIRYNVKDIITTKRTTCDTGIQLRTANHIQGRDVDVITTISGRKLIVHYFTGYFEWINEIDQFQCILTNESTLLVKLVVNNMFSETIKDKVFKDVSNYIGKDMNLVVSIVDYIPQNSINGKRRFLFKGF